MSGFNDHVGPEVVKALSNATYSASTWQLFLATLTHDMRDEILEVLKADADVEEALMMAPPAEQLQVARAINVYCRSQTSDCAVPRSPELSEEEASRAELVAAKITYEMLKLRGHHRQPTIEDLFRMLR